jgi:hypothetical protein
MALASLSGAVWDLLVLGLANWAMARRIVRRPGEAFHWPVLAGFLVVAASMVPSLAISLAQGGLGSLHSEFRQAFDTMAAGLSGTDAASKKVLAAFAERWLWVPFPAWMAVVWLLWLTFNVLVLRKFLVFRGRAAGLKPVLGWSLPTEAVLFLLVPAFTLLGLQSFGAWDGHPVLAALCQNLLVLVLPCYLFQGFLVAQWSLLRRGFPSRLTWLGWILTLVFLGPLRAAVALFLVLIGVLDTWFDLRRLQAPPAEAAGGEKS